VNGIDPFDYSGGAVSGAGDVNGDGVDDLAIGAGLADGGGQQNAGEGYVLYGRNTARDGDFPAVIPLARLLPAAGGDGSGGFVLIRRARIRQRRVFRPERGGHERGWNRRSLHQRARGGSWRQKLCGESYIVYGRSE
jgi:hypothetical protein